MISEDAKYDDGVVQEAVVEKFVKYFKAIFHHNSWYFGYFVACEFLNFFLLGVQFTLTDRFLNNKFQWYGWEVVHYYSFSYRDRMNPLMAIRSQNSLILEQFSTPSPGTRCAPCSPH